jgi:hypothetical protein
MSLYALRICRNAGLQWSWKKLPATAVTVIVAALIIFGVYIDIFGLQLEPVAEWNTLRYINNGWQGPPIPAIITIIILLLMGLSLAVRSHWPWLLLGAAIMFIISGGLPSFGVLTNLAEIILVVAMVTTARHFPHQNRVEHQTDVNQSNVSLGNENIQI